ncbi:PREDICTED: uncharacterized protein LOC109334573 isoform X2 [Lupinus angustifolius]|uniref:uncharacterized protein LOC109334573 isoform X2 n=1 Tax=Lupinus angustifolius TaxID=3871 RepID=UPI00092F4775|nr:PREDICTED: uncharacterized protein LOC109334573 isoform X2 [Lupinus angustifolius]
MNKNNCTSDLFVCFTSKFSSSFSSMKFSSKSILSPSRSREPPQISLQSSLSRKLRNNGSMKGGQASPMFPTTGGKKRGCGFENPEPSSPKVTCIGQVRVKTKKQGNKMRSRSKRRGGEALSFRKSGTEPDLIRQNSKSFQYQLQQECLKHRNQRWVHLPLTICEAMREFTCFFPCKSSCVSKEEKGGGEVERSNVEENVHGSVREGSSEAAFAKWLVALQEGDGKGREIDLVMKQEDDENGKGNERSYSKRKHVVEDIEVVEEEEEKGRVSICVPPKNALLLMRCRSDPVKMAALANRFWESPIHEDHDFDEDEVGAEKEHIQMEQYDDVEEERNSICASERESGFVNIEENHVIIQLEETETETETLEVKESYEVESNDNDEGENFSCVSNSTLEVHHHAGLDKPETEEVQQPSLKNVKEEQQNEESLELYPTPSKIIAPELQNDEAKPESEAEQVTATMAEPESETITETSEEKVTVTVTAEISFSPKQQEEETDPIHVELDPVTEPGQGNGSEECDERERLPECLLLMMCEPKLSMEVSKETWVCSTDFVRWLPPERIAGKPNDAVVVERRASMGSKPNKKPSPQRFLQPPRSSCSFPAMPAAAVGGLAGMIEQKLVGSKSSNKGFEPFVFTRCKPEPFLLTRCKSEPVRSSARLAPEACFWKDRKLEPATLEVGAPAGVGF